VAGPEARSNTNKSVQGLSMTYRYHARVLDELARHGLQPLPTTAPGALRDAVRDLYKYEIRVLRERHLAGQIPKRDYASHVVALRRRYWLLSVPTELWTLDRTGHPGGETPSDTLR
jgi:hypothetical protein